MLRVFLLRTPIHRYIFYAHSNDFVSVDPPTPSPSTSKFQTYLNKFQDYALMKWRTTRKEIENSTTGKKENNIT